MPGARQPGPEPDWTFPPEGELFSNAGELAFVRGPLRLASFTLGATVLAVQDEAETLLESPEAEAAASICVLSFRSTRAVAVLVAAGLTIESHAQVRRLAEFAVLAEYLKGPEQSGSARRWLNGQISPSKLFKGEVQRKAMKYLSQGAHADARHLRDLERHDGTMQPWPARDVLRDVTVPWAAACLARDVLLACESVLGQQGRSAQLEQEINLYADGAKMALEHQEG